MYFLKCLYLNLVFYVLAITFSIVVIPPASVFITLCACILPRRLVMKYLRWVILFYGAVIIRIFPFPLVRITYNNYQDNDTKKPCIFVCNHRSSSDPFLMAVLFRECVQVVNKWPFRLPVLGIIAKAAGYLSVREMSFEDFFHKTIRFLREGVSIIVFPEGTRSKNNRIGQFHGAIFRTALETKVPIVPLCITGNENIPAIGSIFLRPGIIKIHRLNAISWEHYAGFSPFKLKNYVRQIIIDEVAAMEKKI